MINIGSASAGGFTCQTIGFDHASPSSLYFTARLPTSFKLNSVISPFFMWAPAANMGTDKAVFTLTMSLQPSAGVYGAPQYESMVTSASSASGTNTRLTFATWDTAAITMTAGYPCIVGVLTRNTGEAADNFADDIAYVSLELRILNDRLYGTST
jgi:hypothetical protein